MLGEKSKAEGAEKRNGTEAGEMQEKREDLQKGKETEGRKGRKN